MSQPTSPIAEGDRVTVGGQPGTVVRVVIGSFYYGGRSFVEVRFDGQTILSQEWLEHVRPLPADHDPSRFIGDAKDLHTVEHLEPGA